MLVVSEKFCQRCVERGRDAIEEKDGDVAFAGLELSEMAFGDVGECGEIFARERTRFAEGADALSKIAEKERIRLRCRRKDRAGILSSGHVE